MRLTTRKYGEIVSSKKEIHCSNFCNNCSQGSGNCKYVKDMIEKLAEYEDLEEQGLLLKLPCKVGSDVYVLDHRFVSTEGIIKCYIDEFTIDKNNKCYAVLSGKEPFYVFRRFKAVNIREFGETVFLTKEAAKEELKKMPAFLTKKLNINREVK